MPTVLDLIRQLAPTGTNPGTGASGEDALASPWSLAPLWPPDAFAIAASLVSKSACYAHPRYTAPAGRTAFTPAVLRTIESTARIWARGPDPVAADMTDADVAAERWIRRVLFESPLRGWWNVLLGHGHVEITARDLGATAVPAWWDAAMYLMLTADEAAGGFGFVNSNRLRLFGPSLVFDEYRLHVLRSPHRELPYLPSSLGKAVPPTEVCVQPKAVTAQLGCTLNSYTHNLSLLPAAREVRATWRLAFEQFQAAPNAPDPHPMDLNVLVVPFPYTVPPEAFRGGSAFGTPEAGRVHNPAHELLLDQTWLRHNGQPISADRFYDELLAPLLVAARAATGQPVHAVVFPEMALDKKLAQGIARRLADEPKIEWLLAGAAFGKRNVSYVSVFKVGQVYEEWWQAKHHRWKVERTQIHGYGLAPPHGMLDPNNDYWEGIDVEGRECATWAFRPGTTMSVLICEDLARREPVQDAIRAIGPNLVVALLMDGAQVSSRWPGRYATVLADDPGSSVLTVTSVGLVDRGIRAREASGEMQNSRSVILWKEPPLLACEPPLPAGCGVRPGRTDAIELAADHQAVLLRLTSRWVGTFSMDGRYDGGATVRVHLNDCHQIRHPAPPIWI